MTKLSVNINKIALLRNSRGTGHPDLSAFAAMALNEGAAGITVHPREDQRHIRYEDLKTLSQLPAITLGQAELNIEADPRESLLDYIYTHVPHVHQITLVPVEKGELTSSRGWGAKEDSITHVTKTVSRLKAQFKLRRVSLFANPTPQSITWCKQAGADAVEFYTGNYAYTASSFNTSSLLELDKAAAHARELGLRIHAGHDLTLLNLGTIIASIKPDEVSIGHHIVCDALQYGFEDTIRRYIRCITTHLS